MASSSSPAAPSLFARARGTGLSLASGLAWIAPLLARIIIGLVFVHSGWGKLHNLDKVVEYFRGLGIPAPELQAPFAAAMEFGCGLLVLIGLFTRLASIPLMVIMVVALKTAYGDQLGKTEGAIDFLNELFGLSEFLYIALLAYLALFGAGALSLDRAFFGRTNERRTA
ncbi:MAG: DoxX family protein [Planctomycetes bacterium]|nr:DoxX family protein [Planctomycetota bacterium]